MSLHPKAKQFLEEFKKTNEGTPPLSEIDPKIIRESLIPTIISDKYETIHLEDHSLEGSYGTIPIQIYRPNLDKDQPVIVFYHGGGFILGDVKGYAPFCQKVAHDTNCTVVSIEYRLAPEYKFPTAIEECYAATKWIYNQAKELGLDDSRFAVMGDSAGGNIAAVVTHLARDKKEIPITLQVLIFPMTSFAIQSISKKKFAEGYFLAQESLDLFEKHYLRSKSDVTNPLASPLLEDLHDLPPAFVLTAEYDPLRDEAEAYVQKLVESGVEVWSKRYAGMIHGFTTFTDLFGDRSIQDISEFIRSKFFI
ncbi:alpha/beta hydrolase [Shimazuella alba]|uniref:Alpha/beta hydrolase fold domain-containing protein n=1 Tax=Shimazuella alba TaxID=2690964 RepID=A0A6I4VVT3_9BACL|nr:alpha/beta hydrolase [Shimazuella alba]MXQ54718.1 alpha/beta hydrolase fold domain-containing protein [Shimazuella alba]